MAGFLGSPLLRNLAVGRSQNLSIIVGYAILGFTNIILPSIIFSACYLIIPYSRRTVTVILVLPALVAKIAIPHVLQDIPWTGTSDALDDPDSQAGA
ncbi:hypothetical protein K4F52_004508 [Lecanicillium sp. MT-2017a]|nr:hypothetical protein K4F52_004508 [Lecanicillium sp. MT-2017a]